MRQINREGLELLIKLEGLRLKSYVCPAGKLTVGIGHTGPDVKPGMVITEDDAYRLLDSDLKTTYDAIEKLVKVKLNDNQYAALVIFVFNIGIGAFKASSLLRFLNAGMYDAVPEQMKRWNKITEGGEKVISMGLTNRRKQEIELWNS